MIRDIVKHKRDQKRDRSTDEIYAALVNRMLVTARKNSSHDEDGSKVAMTLGLTSCSDGDGVSTVAFNLARFCAEALQLNTLYLDISNGDLPFENTFLRNASQVDFQRVLDAESSVADAVEDSCVDGLSVLSFRSGEDFVYSPFVVSQFGKVFQQLNQLFEIVVLDLPPVGGMASGLSIAKQIDSVVLVVKSGKTKKDEAAAVASFLKKAGVNLVGALANGAETELPGFRKAVAEFFAICLEGLRLPVRFAKACINLFAGRS